MQAQGGIQMQSLPRCNLNQRNPPQNGLYVNEALSPNFNQLQNPIEDSPYYEVVQPPKMELKASKMNVPQSNWKWLCAISVNFILILVAIGLASWSLVNSANRTNSGTAINQSSADFESPIVVSQNDFAKEKREMENYTRFQRNVEARLDEIEAKLECLMMVRQPPASLSSSSSSSSSLNSCSDSDVSGVQTLSTGETVVCDQQWTVFQRRSNGRVGFNRNWQDYKLGFGNLCGEFWMGLDRIHNLTTGGNCRLRIDLWSFDDSFAYAEYSSFSVESESSNYVLHVDGYSGTAEDSLRGGLYGDHDNQPFTTRDRDNDNYPTNCAQLYEGGWWYNRCFRSALNNPWGPSTGHATGIIWYSWKGYGETIKATTMKLRCD